MNNVFGNLPLALTHPGRISLKSDASLVRRVKQHLLPDSPLHVQPVSEVHTAGQLDEKPLSLLHRLGRATSSLPALYGSNAAGLNGLAALQMSSQWAILKYLWAFDPATPSLRLSAITDQVRSHQRAVLSEQLGIGLATSVVESLLLSVGDGPARIVDVDAWESDPQLFLLIGVLASHRPDYIFYTSGPNPKLFVIEVKGTSASTSAMIRQLARGVEQVATIGPISGYQVRRIVIGTVVTGGLAGYAVEVPIGSELKELEARRQVMARRVRDSKLMSAHLDANSTDKFRLDRDLGEIPFELPVEVVDAALDRGEDARLLTIAGLATNASDLLTKSVPTTARVSALTTREVGGLIYAGSTTQAQIGVDQTLAVFSGVHRDVLDVVASREQLPRRARETRRIAATVSLDSPDATVVRVQGADLAPVLIAQSSDGCLLVIDGLRS